MGRIVGVEWCAEGKGVWNESNQKDKREQLLEGTEVEVEFALEEWSGRRRMGLKGECDGA